MYVKVIVEISVKAVDKMFIYSIPREFLSKIKVGSRVKVSFGYQVLEGFVLEIIDKKFWKDRERDIKQAIKIILVKGPRGGFKYMRIWSVDRSCAERIYTTDIKHEAEKLVLIAEQYHKVVIEEVQ